MARPHLADMHADARRARWMFANPAAARQMLHLLQENMADADRIREVIDRAEALQSDVRIESPGQLHMLLRRTADAGASR